MLREKDTGNRTFISQLFWQKTYTVGEFLYDFLRFTEINIKTYRQISMGGWHTFEAASKCLTTEFCWLSLHFRTHLQKNNMFLVFWTGGYLPAEEDCG